MGSLVFAAAALAMIAAVAPITAHAEESGATGGGYGWIDARDFAYDWIDIAGTGLNLGHCDDCVRPASIGFSFRYYGEEYTSVNVGANGVLQFGDAATQWGPFELPDDHFGSPVMLPLWSDWDPTSGGDVFVETTTWHGQTAFVAQWDNVASWDCDRSGAAATWEVILLRDGSFVFQYEDTDLGDGFCDRGQDMTVGIQRDGVNCYVQYSNQQDVIGDGTAIRWAAQDDECGSVPRPTATPVTPTGTAEPTSTSTHAPAGIVTLASQTAAAAGSIVEPAPAPVTGTLGDSRGQARRDEGRLPGVGSGPPPRHSATLVLAFAAVSLLAGTVFAALGASLQREQDA